MSKNFPMRRRHTHFVIVVIIMVTSALRGCMCPSDLNTAARKQSSEYLGRSGAFALAIISHSGSHGLKESRKIAILILVVVALSFFNFIRLHLQKCILVFHELLVEFIFVDVEVLIVVIVFVLVLSLVLTLLSILFIQRHHPFCPRVVIVLVAFEL